MVLLIHVLLMYCAKACKVSVTAFVSSLEGSWDFFGGKIRQG